MTLVIKNAQEKILREFKAEAARRGLSLSQAFEEAVKYWLTFKDREVLSEADLNNIAYESLENDFREHSGKYAVVVEGRLAGIFASLEEVSAALRKFHPTPKHALVVKIGFDDRVLEGLEWLGGSMNRATA